MASAETTPAVESSSYLPKLADVSLRSSSMTQDQLGVPDRRSSMSVATVSVAHRTTKGMNAIVSTLHQGVTDAGATCRQFVVCTEAADCVNHDLNRGVKVLSLKENLGYAGGLASVVNGMIPTDCSIVIVTSDDVQTNRESVNALVQTLMSDQKLGVVGPTLYANRSVYSSGGLFEDNWPLHRTHVHHDVDVSECDFVDGAMLAVRAEVLISSLPTWGDLFMYWEDVAISLACKQVGLGVATVPNATASKSVGTRGRPLEASFLRARNGMTVLTRFARPNDAAAYRDRAREESSKLLKRALRQVLRGTLDTAVYSLLRSIGLTLGCRTPLEQVFTTRPALLHRIDWAFSRILGLRRDADDPSTRDVASS